MSRLPATIAHAQLVSTGTFVHLIGGIVNGRLSDAIYSARINSEGILESWTLTAELPYTSAYGNHINVGKRLYIFGGLINNDKEPGCFIVDILDNGLLAPHPRLSSLPPHYAIMAEGLLNNCYRRVSAEVEPVTSHLVRFKALNKLETTDCFVWVDHKLCYLEDDGGTRTLDI